MKYLVIGDSSSMHIYNFVKTVLLPQNYKVYLLTLSIKPIRQEFLEFYKQNDVTVYSLYECGYKDLDKTDKFHRLINLYRKFLLMKRVPKVDICHIQSVYKTSIAMVLKNRKKFKKLILSYWGGDIENRSRSVVEIRKKCFALADAITVTAMKTMQDFREIYGRDFDDKLKVCRFATDGLNCIDKLSKTISRDECRQCYNIPKGKICITCGYSAYREQHQDRCIEEINKLPKELKDKLFVIVPMQYGRMDDKEYFARVEEAKEKADFECIILKEFVPFEMSAKLAIATDIYLHLRDTDAFSNALKEHVYAGSEIVSGKWLKYIELDEMNAPVRYISDFNQLKDTLEILIKDYQPKNEMVLFEPIYNLYSTENIVKVWQDVIDFAVNTSL